MCGQDPANPSHGRCLDPIRSRSPRAAALTSHERASTVSFGLASSFGRAGRRVGHHGRVQCEWHTTAIRGMKDCIAKSMIQYVYKKIRRNQLTESMSMATKVTWQSRSQRQVARASAGPSPSSWCCSSSEVEQAARSSTEAAADVFRIPYDATARTVTYDKNGSVLYTSTSPPPYPAYVGTSMWYAGSLLDNVVIGLLVCREHEPEPGLIVLHDIPRACRRCRSGSTAHARSGLAGWAPA